MGPLLNRLQENLASPDRKTIQNIFNRIALRYDSMNRLLSFGLDEGWRRRAARLILKEWGEREKILDLGVGTGKFLRRFFERQAWQLAVGVDFADEMLQRARRNLPSRCPLLRADIEELPFKEESFDLAVSSFTLRSVQDRPHFFKEIRRILRPKGKAAFLCLTRPPSFFWRMLYLPYLKFYLPVWGRILTGDPSAYQFLSQSIQAFPSPPEIAHELESLGFQSVRLFSFTFGISTLILAQK